MRKPKMTSLLLDVEDRRLLASLATMEKCSKAEILRRSLRQFAEENGIRTNRLRTRKRHAGASPE